MPSARLAPFPRFKALDQNAGFLAGGKLYTYSAGSNTPKATYTDESGATANQNPVILDGSGEADIWLAIGAYKFILTDQDDVVQWTVDNVEAQQSDIVSDSLTTGIISISGQLTSSVTGIAPFVVASTVKVVNLNADQLDGADWSSPGAIGNVTPSSGNFTAVVVNDGLVVNVSDPIAFKVNASTLSFHGQSLDTDGGHFSRITTAQLNVDGGLGAGLGAAAIIKGIYAGSASVDFPSIGATTRGSIAVAVAGSGVDVGDLIVVLAGPQLLNDDLVFIGAVVTSFEHITFYAYNPTGGSIDNAALTFTFLWMDLT